MNNASIQSLNQSIDWSPIRRAPIRRAPIRIIKSINQSINQRRFSYEYSINQSIDQSSDDSINQSTNRHYQLIWKRYILINRSIGHCNKPNTRKDEFGHERLNLLQEKTNSDMRGWTFSKKKKHTSNIPEFVPVSDVETSNRSSKQRDYASSDCSDRCRCKSPELSLSWSAEWFPGNKKTTHRICRNKRPGRLIFEARKNIPKSLNRTFRFCVVPPLKNHSSKPIGFVYSPLWKINHHKPSVFCTPPFEKSPIKTHRFHKLPLWKITHQNPLVSSTPPFEKSSITIHRFCVLPPLENHCFWWRLFRDGRLFRQIR